MDQQSNGPAFKIQERSIPDREVSRRHNNNSNVVKALPKRLEQAKLRNMVMKIVKQQQKEGTQSLNRKQSNGTCMTQEDVTAFKNYDAAQ